MYRKRIVKEEKSQHGMNSKSGESAIYLIKYLSEFYCFIF